MSERDVRMYNPTHRHLQRRSGMPPTDEPVVRWDQQFQGNVSGVVVCDRRVYVSTGSDIVAMDHDGTGRWRFETDRNVVSSPAVVDGTVFVGSNDKTVYALDAATGTRQWAFETDGTVSSSPAVVDGTVFVGSGQNVYALDAATGTRQWAFETDGLVNPSPAVVDGTVFVGSFDGNVYALDAATGTRQWAFETDGTVSSSPAVVDGTVFVGSYDGNVYALGGDATGAERVGDTEAYDPCPNPTCEVNLSKYGYESEVNFCPVCGTELRAEEGSDTRVYDPR